MIQRREGTKPELFFENLWKKSETEWHSKIQQLWKRNFPMMPEHILSERVREVAFAVTTAEGEVVAVSTAYKTYIEQLKHHLYGFRCFVDPAYRVPGLTTKILVKTRDWLEAIYLNDGPDHDRCIGVITMVENERLMKYRNEAVWRGSKMVYIGNSPQGKHLRVYYFKKALI
jgi:hypothetical protein